MCLRFRTAWASGIKCNHAMCFMTMTWWFPPKPFCHYRRADNTFSAQPNRDREREREQAIVLFGQPTTYNARLLPCSQNCGGLALDASENSGRIEWSGKVIPLSTCKCVCVRLPLFRWMAKWLAYGWLRHVGNIGQRKNRTYSVILQFGMERPSPNHKQPFSFRSFPHFPSISSTCHAMPGTHTHNTGEFLHLFDLLIRPGEAIHILPGAVCVVLIQTVATALTFSTLHYHRALIPNDHVEFVLWQPQMYTWKGIPKKNENEANNNNRNNNNKKQQNLNVKKWDLYARDMTRPYCGAVFFQIVMTRITYRSGFGRHGCHHPPFAH